MTAPETVAHLPPLLRAFADSMGEDGAELRETHASWVVLAGDRAWKVKKPLAFAFLDQRTPERRRAACEAELELNRPLAPDVYLAVRGLAWAGADGEPAGGVGAAGEPAGAGDGGMGEDGEPAGASGARLTDPDDPGTVEYAVEMRRFDERETLAGLIERDALEPGHLHAVAARLAGFHAQAPLAPPDDAPREPAAAAAAQLERLDRNGEELIALLAEPAEPAERAAVLAQLRGAAAFAVAHADLLAARARDGHVRELHGDLRAEHVLPGALPADGATWADGERGAGPADGATRAGGERGAARAGEGVRLVDRLEFNRAWREVDAADELAFLAMDLTALGRPDAATELLAAYRAAGGDAGDDRLVAFHAVYRAHVRAKVSLLRAAQEEDDGALDAAARERRRAETLLAVAERFAWRLRLPPVLVVCGPSASGKSVLAAEIGRRAGLEPISSDVVRKRLAGVAPTERAGEAVYDEAMNARTYAALGAAAANAAATGGAIVDATFRRRADRDAFARGLADAAAANAASALAGGVDPHAEGAGAHPSAPAGGVDPHAAGRPPVVAFVELTAAPEVLKARAQRRLGDAERVSDGTPDLAVEQLAAFEPLAEVAPERHHLLRADRTPQQLADALAAALDATPR